MVVELVLVKEMAYIMIKEPYLGLGILTQMTVCFKKIKVLDLVVVKDMILQRQKQMDQGLVITQCQTETYQLLLLIQWVADKRKANKKL
jgi:hypothetical protein